MTISNKSNVTKRSDKTIPLTQVEVDRNFQELRNVIDDSGVLEQEIDNHVNGTDPDPHPQYASQQVINDHVNGTDPHTQYALEDDLSDNTSTNGSDLIAHTGTSDTVTEALDKRTIFVGSVAELETLSLAEGASVYLTEEGREGDFVVETGAAPNDPQQGICVVLANGNYAKRQYNKPLNPKWFGAKGDGVADDTAALQAMFDFATDTRASAVFPDGDYRITSTVTLDASKVAGIMSHGDARIKVDGTNFSGFKVVGTLDSGAGTGLVTNQNKKLTEFFVLITGMTFYGTNYTVTGLEFERVFEPVVHNCRFISMLSGIKLSVRNRNFTVTDSMFWDNVYGIHWNRVNLHQQIVSGCQFATRNDGATPEHCLFFDGGDVHNIQIVGCGLEGFGNCGAIIKVLMNGNPVEGATHEQWSQVAISGCSIESHLTNVEPLIDLELNDPDATALIVQITGNEFSGSSSGGFGVSSSSSNDGLINSLTFSGNTGWGIEGYFIDINGALSSFAVCSNTMSDTGDDLRIMGFLRAGPNALIEHWTITGNAGSNLVLGAFRLQTRVALVYEVTITDNNMAFAYGYGGSNIAGFAFDLDFTGKGVSGLQVRGNSTRVRGYIADGMRVVGASYDKVIIKDNLVRGQGATGFTRFDLPAAAAGNIAVADNI